MKANEIMTAPVITISPRTPMREIAAPLESEDAKRAARVAAENVPGVRKVEDHRMRVADLPSML